MLVYQVLLVSDVPCQHISPKDICQLYVSFQDEQHGLSRDSQKRAVCHCASRGRAATLTGKGIFANKIAIAQYGEDCFLPSFWLNAESYRSFLNDKYGVCRIVQTVNCLPIREGHHLPTNADGCEKSLRVESPSLLALDCSVQSLDISSAAIKRRSRCGSVRGCPVLSSHFSPGPAPHVGQRTACTCLRVGFLAFTILDSTGIRRRKMVTFEQEVG